MDRDDHIVVGPWASDPDLEAANLARGLTGHCEETLVTLLMQSGLVGTTLPALARTVAEQFHVGEALAWKKVHAWLEAHFFTHLQVAAHPGADEWCAPPEWAGRAHGEALEEMRVRHRGALIARLDAPGVHQRARSHLYEMLGRRAVPVSEVVAGVETWLRPGDESEHRALVSELLARSIPGVEGGSADFFRTCAATEIPRAARSASLHSAVFLDLHPVLRWAPFDATALEMLEGLWKEGEQAPPELECMMLRATSHFDKASSVALTPA